VIINQKIVEAAHSIAVVYRFCPVGGNLHVVIDDENLDDEFVTSCAQRIEEEAARIFPRRRKYFRAERDCAEKLKALSVEERQAAIDYYNRFL
jgi:hypothetical protein